MQHQLGSTRECRVSFAKFGIAVTVGSMVGFGASMIGRYATRKEHRLTRDAAATFAHAAGFWLAGGIAWILLTRQQQDDG